MWFLKWHQTDGSRFDAVTKYLFLGENFYNWYVCYTWAVSFFFIVFRYVSDKEARNPLPQTSKFFILWIFDLSLESHLRGLGPFARLDFFHFRERRIGLQLRSERFAYYVCFLGSLMILGQAHHLAVEEGFFLELGEFTFTISPIFCTNFQQLFFSFPQSASIWNGRCNDLQLSLEWFTREHKCCFFAILFQNLQKFATLLIWLAIYFEALFLKRLLWHLKFGQIARNCARFV